MQDHSHSQSFGSTAFDHTEQLNCSSLLYSSFCCIAMNFGQQRQSSSFPRRTNSTNPRPANRSYYSRASNNASTNAQQIPPAAAAAGRPVHDSGAGKQVNQTFSIAMMVSPVNPLPFPLPIPLGVTMLLSPSGNSNNGNKNSRSGQQQRQGSPSPSSAARR